MRLPFVGSLDLRSYFNSFALAPTQDAQRHLSGARAAPKQIELKRSNYTQILETLKRSMDERPFVMVFSSSRNVEEFPQFMDDAKRVGELLAHTNAIYGYGNGNVGMMGGGSGGFVKTRKSIGLQSPHPLLGIGTPNFCAVEDDQPGALVAVARDLDLRERLMIDLAIQTSGAIICLDGGNGTIAEATKYLSQDGYIHKSQTPLVFINTEYEHPDLGKTRAWQGLQFQLQTSIGKKMTTDSHLQSVRFANTPDDAVTYLLENVQKLKKEAGIPLNAGAVSHVEGLRPGSF